MIGSNEPHSPTAKNDTTPPAAPEGNSDVREALALKISAYRHGSEVIWDEDQRLADDLLAVFEVRPRGTVTDPNTIPDDVADAAQVEHYEFAFGKDAVPLTQRLLGITRQAWKCAIAVAIDKMKERP